MNKKKKPSVNFPPERPITNPLLLYNEDKLRSVIGSRTGEDAQRLWVLCKHYEIEPGPMGTMLFELALRMARDLYPEPKQKGRKAKWTPVVKGMLVVEMEQLIEPDNKARGISWAAKTLSKRDPWKSFLESKDSLSTTPNPAEVLRTTYSVFRNNPWAEMSRKAFKLDEMEGTQNEWAALLESVVRKDNSN